jgi:hypothetical protein
VPIKPMMIDSAGNGAFGVEYFRGHFGAVVPPSSSNRSDGSGIVVHQRCFVR